MNLKKILVNLSVVILALNFTACGPSKLLMDTYAPPHKEKEVKKMLENSDSKSGFLELEIVSNIVKANGIKSDKEFDAKLLSSLQKFITQTNFIAINSVEMQSAMSLDMKVLIYDYKQDVTTIKGTIAVEFNIRKEGTVFYTQNYKYNIHRYSKSGFQGISKSSILSQASDYLAKKLIKDISPIATQKLVALKSLPSELEYTVAYVKTGNFEGAIKGMRKYKGKKTSNYYFNLAVYYEALASKTDSLELLTKADEYYEKAMMLSNGKDKDIVYGKSKFDNYYRIIKKVADQKRANAKSSTNDNFELLE